MASSLITPQHATLHWLGLCVVLFSTVGMVHAATDPLLTTPPPKPVRIPAEFEPMQGVIASMEMAVEDFVREVTEDVNLVLLGGSESEHNYIQRQFQGWGVDPDRCEFHRIASSPVPRDGLPWFMFIDQNKPASVYNRRHDDMFSVPAYGLDLGYPVYRSGILLEGGDFMTDGQGIGVSLDGVTITHAEMGDEFAERILDYWGIHTHHPVANARWGVEGYMHIDCLAKFLSPDTVMVVRVPPSDVRREQSEETAAYFRRQVSCYGTPYAVVRVDVPDREPYINSLILNRKVFVPMLDVVADANAIASYEAAMPGYEVIGISGVWWLPFFALHCHTMNVPDEQMLYIEHTPILDRPAAAEGIPIGARIVAYSGEPFIAETPVVVWKVQGQDDWQRTGMTLRSDVGEDQYRATIPAHPVGTVIEYYLHAEDASGRSENHPYIGAPQAHTFTVKPFGADVSAVSAGKGGAISFYMNAEAAGAQQDYTLTYTLDVNEPDTAATVGEALPETAEFTGFQGTLDPAGVGAARLTLPGPLPSHWIGGAIHFDFTLDQAPEAVLDGVTILILE